MFCTLGLSEENIFIKLKVNDYIVTNIDIKKEAAYLEILNPNISELDNAKIYDLTKKSIVNEIIKKNEINKFFVLEDKDFIDSKLLDDLMKRLDLNQSEFENLLIQKKSYSLARGRKREAKKEKNEGGKKNFSEEKIKKIRERRAHTHF